MDNCTSFENSREQSLRRFESCTLRLRLAEARLRRDAVRQRESGLALSLSKGSRSSTDRMGDSESSDAGSIPAEDTL